MMIVREANFGRKSLIRHRSIFNNLPENLLIEVFQRLPQAKFVIRCQLVCKNWYAIISSSNFISSFIIQQHHPKMNSEKISYFVPESAKLQFPLFLREISSRKVKVIASCNDLLLCQLSERVYCIYNPLTGQYATLPPTPNQIIHLNVFVSFVCDPYISYNELEENDVTINPHYNYKIVFLFHCWDKPKPMEIIVREFSSETNKWSDRNVDVPDPRSCCMVYPCKLIGELVFHKGMGFWINHNFRCICIYNPQNQSIVRAGTAPPRRGTALAKPVIGLSRGFLRYFELVFNSPYFTRKKEDHDKISVNVWELNSGEWSLVHDVYLHQLGDLWRPKSTYFELSALAIDPNDVDIVYIKVGIDHNIMLCNLREMEMKLHQRGFVTDCSYYRNDVFPVMSPPWPTPIRSLAS